MPDSDESLQEVLGIDQLTMKVTAISQMQRGLIRLLIEKGVITTEEIVEIAVTKKQDLIEKLETAKESPELSDWSPEKVQAYVDRMTTYLVSSFDAFSDEIQL